jgi:hypothetical protein
MSFLVLCLACSNWRPVTIANSPGTNDDTAHAQIDDAATVIPSDLAGKRVRFRMPSDTIEITVSDVDPPYVRGYAEEQVLGSYMEALSLPVEVDLRDVLAMEIQKERTILSFGVLLLFGAGIFGLIMLLGALSM